MGKVTITQPAPPSEEIATEVIASAIVAISDGIKKLRSGRLNDRALFILIQNASPDQISQRDIKAVLSGIENLRSAYIRKLPPAGVK